MREIRTSGLMSGDGRRGDAERPATAPILDSTQPKSPMISATIQIHRKTILKTSGLDAKDRFRRQRHSAGASVMGTHCLPSNRSSRICLNGW
jgi:hypothetical protein